MTFLDIDGVSKRYGSIVALENISLSVPAGCRTAIVGPSGSGKTTLLRLIAGFEAPDSGSITLEGRVLADAKGYVPAHRREIGFVTQDGALFPHLTIAENIGFGLDDGAAGRRERIAELADVVDLDDKLLSRRPHELSGGQQQRVALARALARKPRLMLLDEPFSALDTGLRQATRKAVAALLEVQGVTAILVTHDQAEALSFADQLVVLQEGRLAQAGPPSALYRYPRDVRTALFLGDVIMLDAQASAGWADCVLGRVALRGNTPPGMTRIMLRPEQIRIAGPRTAAGAAAGKLCSAQVIDIEFSGAQSMVVLAVPGSGECLRIPVVSHDMPPIGSLVLLEITGPAHVFEDGDGHHA